MTADDRVTYNDPDTWSGPAFLLGTVDEIVLSDATAHFEMSDYHHGYLHVRSPRRQVFARISARATTVEERRQIREHSGERFAPKAVLCVEVELDEAVGEGDAGCPTGDCSHLVTAHEAGEHAGDGTPVRPICCIDGCRCGSEWRR